MEIEKNYTDDCNTEDKNKTGEIPSHHFKKIKSGMCIFLHIEGESWLENKVTEINEK